MDVFMEGLQDRQLRLHGHRHVVFDGVQGAQHQVEDADRVAQPRRFVRQLLNYHRKAAQRRACSGSRALHGLVHHGRHEAHISLATVFCTARAAG